MAYIIIVPQIHYHGPGILSKYTKLSNSTTIRSNFGSGMSKFSEKFPLNSLL